MSNLSEMFEINSGCSSTFTLENTALVAEGGGQRGIYTAGVLDSWLYKGFNPFSLLIGTSAGAQNLSSYITCQKGFARRAIFGLTQKPNFFKLKRALIRRSAVDLDWYFDQFENATLPLNIEQGSQRLKTRKLLFSATNTSTRRAEFFEPSRENWLHLLKATSALPLLYRDGVQIGEQRYVDGGLAAPIPVREAYEQGARRIVVIRTVPKNAKVESPWAHKLKSLVCSRKRCPSVIDLLTHHENAYKRAIDFIENPPDDLEIVQIFPEDNLGSKLVNSSYQDLDRDYSEGVRAGLTFLEEYGRLYV